jgi:hypothetical protein
METLIGTLLGGLFRMAPEVLKWLDRNNERAHEVTMFDKQIELDKTRTTNELALEKSKGDFVLAGKDIDALIAGAKAQAMVTGVKWVDAINSLMRPAITFWWVIVLQTAVMVATVISLSGSSGGYLDALMKIWGPEEKSIVASIISFWFLDRVLRRPG